MKSLVRVTLVMVIVGFSFVIAMAQGWEKIRGATGIVVSRTLGGSLETYATEGPGVNPTGDIYVRTVSGGWQKIGGPGKNFVVGPSTSLDSFLVGLSPDGGGVYKWTGAGQSWAKIGGAAGEIYGGGAGIFATNPQSGDLMAYTQGKWTKVGGPGKSFAVNDKDLFGLSPDGKGVFQYTGNPMKWIQIGGPAAKLIAGGDKLFATNPDTGDIYRYNNKPFSWTKVGGPGKMFAVVGNRLYGLSPDGKAIFRYDEFHNQWVNISSPGGLGADRIMAGLYLYATAANTGELWQYISSN